MGGAPLCGRPRGHGGQHWHDDDGHRYRWGGGGPDSPESARTGKVVSIRLSPAARQALDALEERWQESRSGAVARLVLEAMAARK
jgi:hypothetical protein